MRPRPRGHVLCRVVDTAYRRIDRRADGFAMGWPPSAAAGRHADGQVDESGGGCVCAFAWCSSAPLRVALRLGTT